MKTVKEEQGGRVHDSTCTSSNSGADRLWSRSRPEKKLAGTSRQEQLQSTEIQRPDYSQEEEWSQRRRNPTAGLLLEGGVAVEYSVGGQTTLKRSSGAAGKIIDSYKTSVHYCTTNEPRTKIGNSMLVLSSRLISSTIMHRKKVRAKIRVFMLTKCVSLYNSLVQLYLVSPLSPGQPSWSC